MATDRETLQEVFDAWGQGVEQGAAAMRRKLTDDCRWEQTGVPTTTGPDEAAALVLGMGQIGIVGIEVELITLAEADGVIMTERVDHMVRPDGSRGATFPVVGVTEFRDGKISAWREYFDSALLAQMANLAAPS